jgi:hypothetical protein
MVLYEYDGNAIMTERIKNNKAGELLRSFQVKEQTMSDRDLKPKIMTLYNEASKLLKEYLQDKTSTFTWSILIGIAAMQKNGQFVHSKII